MDKHGVHVDLSNIQFIQDSLAQMTIRDLHIFLTLANYYISFMLGLSHITLLLSKVTKYGEKENFSLSKS